jgi:phosphatidylserine decarboxylase
MAKTLEEWIDSDVRPYQDKSVAWLSQHHFFRDPSRPTYSDLSYFFAPADGVIVYQRTVEPEEEIVDIKGRPYSLREALREPDFKLRSLVIGIFMTFLDVHVNRIPYPGQLSYKELDPIDTYNHPMLDVEKSIFDDLRIPTEAMGYLHHNQRMVNRVYSSELGGDVLHFADRRL